MSDFHRLATNITKGKLPGEHWNQFCVEYKSRTNRLVGAQIALNIVSILMDDHLWQEEELKVVGVKLIDLIRKCQAENFSADALGTEFKEFRSFMKNYMECLVSYNDKFMIYQYVLNLIKYRFEDYDYDDYSDEEFTNELMNYIVSDRDSATVRYKTMDVLKNLPIRMTKNRFFEMVKDGFSVYQGGSSDSLMSFDYMVRGAALLYTPENMEKHFPELYSYSEHFKALDLDAIDAESFYNENMTLMECVDYLNSHISSCQLLAECINQLYAFVLTSDYVKDETEFDTVKKILNQVCVIGVPEEGYEPDEALEILLAELEGIQEEELEVLMMADSLMDDILASTFAAQAGEGQQDEFRLVDSLRLLVSSSYFADIDDDTEIVDVTESMMAKVYSSFKDDMTELLKSSSKLMGRALMASVIGRLPMNFGNTDELRTYIYNSLAACTSLPEKMALVEQLEMLMNADMDWDSSFDD